MLINCVHCAVIGRSMAIHDIIDGLPIFDCGTIEESFFSQAFTIRTVPNDMLRYYIIIILLYYKYVRSYYNSLPVGLPWQVCWPARLKMWTQQMLLSSTRKSSMLPLCNVWMCHCVCWHPTVSYSMHAHVRIDTLSLGQTISTASLEETASYKQIA